MRGLQSTPLHPQWHAYRGAAAKLRMLAREASGRVLDLGAAPRWRRALLPPARDRGSLDYPASAVALYGVRPDIFGTATCLPFRDASFATVLLLASALPRLWSPALFREDWRAAARYIVEYQQASPGLPAAVGARISRFWWSVPYL